MSYSKILDDVLRGRLACSAPVVNEITDVTDINEVTESGWYTYSGTHDNCPTKSDISFFEVINFADETILQRAYEIINTGKVVEYHRYRKKNSSGWSEWSSWNREPQLYYGVEEPKTGTLSNFREGDIYIQIIEE